MIQISSLLFKINHISIFEKKKKKGRHNQIFILVKNLIYQNL